MVLVRGGPERLGDVVRCVVGLSPDADVLVRADALASLAPGSTVVLCLRREDFDWLNIGRPVVLGHRVVLFGDPETALALERHAVDFCDWISHRIDAPAGPPAFAVRALKNAARARSPAIVWKGGDVDAVFSEALPGRSLRRVSAAQPYPELVEALRPRAKTWVLVTDLEEAFRVRRARWAMAEAGRYGRTILMRPGMEITGLPIAHAIPSPLEVTTAKLEEAGIRHGARLAGLLDLEPEAIERAVTMAKDGANEAEIDARLGEVAQPRLPPRDTSARRLPGWPERVGLALGRGDDEVALHWATHWREVEPRSARATASLGYVVARMGRLDDARAFLEEATTQAGAAQDAETAFEIRRLVVWLHARDDEMSEMVSAVDDVLRLLRQIERPADEADELYYLRVRGLLSLGLLDEAERAVRDWPSHPAHPDDRSSLEDAMRAVLKEARGNEEGRREVESAIPVLRRVLACTEGRDSPIRDDLAGLLAGALLDQNAFEDAERITRTAIENAELRGRRSDLLRREHIRALLQLGRFADAERDLRQLLAIIPKGADAAVPRYELALCLSNQGRLDEAAAVLDEAIAELQSAPPVAPRIAYAMLYEKVHLYLLRGDSGAATALFREVLREAERAAGEDHAILVQLLTMLGDSLIDRRDPAAAQPFLRRAQRIAEKIGDKVWLALALGNLAIAQAMQRFPQAADTARRALKAWARAGGEAPERIRADLETIAAGGRASKAFVPRREPAAARRIPLPLESMSPQLHRGGLLLLGRDDLERAMSPLPRRPG